MGYRIDIDQRGCINCGVCMDVCPVEALDMSRPGRPGVASRAADTLTKPEEYIQTVLRAKQNRLAAPAQSAAATLARLEERR